MATISELTPAETVWIQEQLAAARGFVAQQVNAPDVTLESLDSAWARWLASGEKDTDRINATINAVGIALGQSLVTATALRWVIAQDEYGTDLALHALPGTADILVYPTNLVAKRWERGETKFIANIHQEIAAQVRDVSTTRASAKPWWKIW